MICVVHLAAAPTKRCCGTKKTGTPCEGCLGNAKNFYFLVTNNPWYKCGDIDDANYQCSDPPYTCVNLKMAETYTDNTCGVKTGNKSNYSAATDACTVPPASACPPPK
jgi:hypothetical protein